MIQIPEQQKAAPIRDPRASHVEVASAATTSPFAGAGGGASDSSDRKLHSCTDRSDLDRRGAWRAARRGRSSRASGGTGGFFGGFFCCSRVLHRDQQRSRGSGARWRLARRWGFSPLGRRLPEARWCWTLDAGSASRRPSRLRVKRLPCARLGDQQRVGPAVVVLVPSEVLGARVHLVADVAGMHRLAAQRL